MLLAFHGTEITEEELVRLTRMEEGGLDIEELAKTAQNQGYRVEIRELTLVDIVDLISCQCFPIVYLNRFPIDRKFSIHAVIPTNVSPRFVTFLDPLRGRRRVSQSTFERRFPRPLIR